MRSPSSTKTEPPDPERLRLRSIPPIRRRRLPRHRPGERFLKGPIPLTWLQHAGRLPGKALHVSIALWYFAGIKRTQEVSLSLSRLVEFGANRYAAARGLRALEAARLVSVVRHVGRRPVVTLLEGPAK
jgi:hypothetical protein